jgi:hypothetical protein
MTHFTRATIALLLAGLIILSGGTEGRAAGAVKIAFVIGNAKYPDNEFVLNDAVTPGNAWPENSRLPSTIADQTSKNGESGRADRAN